MVKADAHRLVNPLQLLQSQAHTLAPDAQILLVALLQANQLCLAGLKQGGIGLAGRTHRAVDAQQFGNRILCQGLGIEPAFPAMQNHPELGAPIPDMVVRDHLVAHPARHARQRITDKGAADVADMHRLGDVRR